MREYFSNSGLCYVCDVECTGEEIEASRCGDGTSMCSEHQAESQAQADALYAGPPALGLASPLERRLPLAAP